MSRKERPLSRADQVRARRQAGGRTARHTAPRRAPAASDLPPVLVRRAEAVSVPRRRRRLRPRRRLDIALPSPGVEMRLPALPAVRLGWRLLSFFLVGFMAALLYLLWTLPAFRVQQARVEGVERLSADQVARSLLVFNKPVFTIDPRAMEAQLRQTQPALASVSVWVGFPAQVVVQVKERQPRLIWEVDGQVQWVDAEGYAFPALGNGDELPRVQASAWPPPPLMVTTPEDESGPQPLMTPEMVEAVVFLRAQAPPGVDLLYDQEHGFGWLDPRGWKVYFGMDVADIDMKLMVYAAIVDTLQNQGIQPALISVEYLHAPYYRLEP